MADAEQNSGAEHQTATDDQPDKEGTLIPDAAPTNDQTPSSQKEDEEEEGEADDGMIQNPETSAVLSESPPRYEDEAPPKPAPPSPVRQRPAPAKPAPAKPAPAKSSPAKSASTSQPQTSHPPPSSQPQAAARVSGATPSATHPTQSGPETAQERKAREYIEQAEKKVKSAQSFLGGLFGGTVKLEDAADLFVKAANAFKVAKRNAASSHAFRRAADLHMQLDTKHEAASNLVEAGQVIKKEDGNAAVECYQRAVEIYTDMGRFSMAARYYSTVAEIYEMELVDFEKAVFNYEQAADFYKGEDSPGSANKCLEKVALMSAQLQQFNKAAEIFEEIGRTCLENRLLKYSAKNHFLRASVCRFCIGSDVAKDALAHFKQLHPEFDGSREAKLIQDLMEAYDEQETERFQDIVKDYDSISRLDPWMTAQLLHIKKAINEHGPRPDIN